MDKNRDTAGVIAFPPLIYGVPLAAALLADRYILKTRLPRGCRLLSVGLFAAAASLVGPAFGEFEKAGTSVDVFEETKALVETGPYARTRNPIYLALTLTYAAIALATRRALPLAALPFILCVMNVGVIEREERYMERKFGERYRSYKSRVPRWL
jgi:protein-S-isoprenylcysteine O-methyltransferase Ste14